jgi:TM2 domain-containing membrane protein YozV
MEPQEMPSRSQPNKGTALVLEILPALFGFFGIGWIYSGRMSTGITLLILGVVVIWGGYAAIILGATVLSAVTFGLGAFAYCFACAVPLIQVGAAAASAISLNNAMERSIS